MDVYQWVDDWEDKDNNIVHYFLRYTIKRVNNTNITSGMDCDLDVVVIYVPKDICPKPSALEAMKEHLP